jgi:hypothetical protein
MRDVVRQALDLDEGGVLAASGRIRADLLEQVERTRELIKQSEELIRRADKLLAAVPFKP